MATRTLSIIFFAGLLLLPCDVLSDSLFAPQTKFPVCHVTRFELSSTYLVAWGDELIVHVEAECKGDIPLITITTNGELITQANIAELWLPINTAQYSFGKFTLCASATSQQRGDEGTSVSVCHTVWLVDENALQGR